MRDLDFATATELAVSLRKRVLSAVEIAEHALARLEVLGPRFNAVAEVTRDLALRQARSADRRLRRGDAGALCGIPYGAKDLLATRGIPTRWGSAAYRSQVFDHDATVIARLASAGAVLAAKLALVELAGGGRYRTPAASLHGPGRNPWDPTKWSGGSSSGSAIAVSAGLVPVAIGSETGGSLVLPGAYCGVSGLRPTFGAVSLAGAMPLAWSSDKLGPMARDVRDLAAVLAAIAGRDELDPLTVDWKFTGIARRRTLRIGVLEAGLADNPITASVFENAVRVLRRAGHRVTSTSLPDVDYSAIFYVILSSESLSAHEGFIRSDKLDLMADPSQADGFRQLLELPLLPYVRAIQARGALVRRVREVLRNFDVLVAPTTLTEAMPVDGDVWAYRGAKRGGNMHMGALVGTPELTVPMGFGKEGMPLGLSFIGDLFSEPVLLRAGLEYQRETDWHQQHPKVDPVPATA
jgi:aspartyl-tRNA(Asn)/glutamyl-tRNA(Gln) amidotransferase subunit A